VKIPITNTRGESALPLIQRMLAQNIKLNVTALFTQAQLDGLRKILRPQDDVIVSIFAGRLADTGVDPTPLMKKAVADFAPLKGSKVLWASTREVYNIYEADRCGCQIITVPPDLIPKLSLNGKSPESYSLETVKNFYDDSIKAGFSL
jgi:transaldolase